MEATTVSHDSKRPNFFLSIGTLVHRSLRNPLRRRSRSGSKSSDDSYRTSSDLSRNSSCSNLRQTPASQEAWKQRCRRSDVGDYLSMNQLETVWQVQDSFVGSVATPVPSIKREFPEAIEVPTFIRHKRSYEKESSSPVELAHEHRSPGPDEAIVVDGMVHPAFRSTPNLHLTSHESKPARKTRPAKVDTPRVYGGYF